MIMAMSLVKCPQSRADALGEELTCHLGVLFDASGTQHGRCPYCLKATGGVMRDTRSPILKPSEDGQC